MLDECWKLPGWQKQHKTDIPGIETYELSMNKSYIPEVECAGRAVGLRL